MNAHAPDRTWSAAYAESDGDHERHVADYGVSEMVVIRIIAERDAATARASALEAAMHKIHAIANNQCGDGNEGLDCVREIAEGCISTPDPELQKYARANGEDQ